jgi:hypothetical protein
MGMRRIEFRNDVDGLSTENEDRWTLLIGGRPLAVEHRWRHTDPSTGQVISESVQVYPLQEFRKTEAGMAFKAELDAAVKLVSPAMPRTTPATPASGIGAGLR